MMNPIIEAWRAKQDQAKQQGQNEGQIAGATLIMINSMGSQIKDQYADQKQTFTDFNSSLLVTNEELKNVQKVIDEGIHKTFKSGQDQMREVGLDVKAQVGEACQRVEDTITEFRQVGDNFHQNLAPIGDQMAELKKTLVTFDFAKIEEIPKSIVRLEKRTENVKKDIQNTQANTTKWSKILFGLLGGFAACFIAFCVAFWFISGLQLKIFKENFEFKKANRDAVIAYQNLKDKYDDKETKYNKLSAFIYWLYNGDTEAYKANYREFEASQKQK